MKRVFLDMDGVLVDFVGEIIDLVYPKNRDYIINGTVKDPMFGSLVYPGGPPEFDSYVESLGLTWWENLKPLPWCMTLISALKDAGNRQGFKLAYLSSPHTYTGASEGKRRWMRRHGLDPADLILTQKKWLCAGPSALLVDDMPPNVELFQEHGGHAHVWPCQFTLNNAVQQSAAIMEVLHATSVLNGG